ncbi:MAG: glycine cleavage system protein GcvH [Deltaproteobacteria bacterium]|nr:glycine cleavage system protein GcvH [Deltaproteobacteria bacterium]
MDTPDNLRYTKEHEWVRIDGEIATIGVTDHAQHALGDIVYVELPKEGETVTREGTFGVLESVKAVSDCYAPLTGTVVEINDTLNTSPERVNEDCYGEGWMIKIRLSNPSELESLMDHRSYEKFLKEESN